MRKKTWLRWLIITPVVLLTLAAILVRPLLWYDTNRPPSGLVTSNFIDLKGVFDISKFRSGVGHDYSYDSGESCRSMKHYFGHAHTYTADHKPTRSLPTASEPNINIYSPFDGIIMINDPEGPPGKDIHIAALHNPAYQVRLFHVDMLPSLHAGAYVKSGQRVATIGPKDGMDIAIEATSMRAPHGVLVSIFQVMTDQAFAPYAAMGFKRDDFIISRGYRDAHPLQCADQGQFAAGSTDAQNDYIYLRPDIYEVGASRGPGAPVIHYGPPQR